MIRTLTLFPFFAISLLSQPTVSVWIHGTGTGTFNISEGSVLAGDETSAKIVVKSSTSQNPRVKVYWTLQENGLDQGMDWRPRGVRGFGRDAGGNYVLVGRSNGFEAEAIENDIPGAGDLVFTLVPNAAYTIDPNHSFVVLNLIDNDGAAPLAPSGITLTSPGNNQVQIAWTDNSDNEDGFRIERSTDDATWDTVTEDGTSPYIEDNLPLDTYFYRVVAYNFAGENASASDSITLTIDAPAAPSGLAATVLSSSSIQLDWTDNSSNETEFEILRNAVDIGSVGANIETFTDTGLTANTAYTYQIRATNDGGSNVSGTVNPTTHPNTIDAPTSLTFTGATFDGSTHGITANWVDNSSIEENFKVQISANSDYSGATETLVGANVTQLGFSGLSSQTYYFRVAAYTTTPSTLQSPWLTGSYAFAAIPPDAPGTVSATLSSDDEVLVQWSASTGATSYSVQRRLGSGSFFGVATGVSVRQFLDTTVVAGNTYGYRVAAIGVGGQSGWSSVASVVVPSPPDPPSPSTEFFVIDSGSIPWGSINTSLASSDVTVYFDQDGAWQSANAVMDIDSRTDNSGNTLTMDGNTYRYTGSWALSGDRSTPGNRIQRFRSQNGSHRKINDIVIRGFNVDCNIGAKGGSIAGDNWIVEDCDFEHTSTGSSGALLDIIPTADGPNEGSNSYTPRCDNIIIRRNVIHDSFGELLYVGGGGDNSSPSTVTGYPAHTRILIEENTFYNGGRWGGEGDGIDMKGGLSGVIIRNNIIRNITDSDARAIVTQGHSASLATYWAEKPGIKVSIYGNVIYDCVLTTRGAIDLNGGSWDQPTGAMEVYNNVIYDITGSPAYGIVHAEAQNGSLFIANNTIARCDGEGIRLSSDPASESTVLNNVLYQNNGSGNQVSMGSTPPTYQNNAYRGSLSPAGSGSINLASDPFTNAAGDDFTIDSSSPLYNAGVVNSIITEDVEGNARVGNPDIGAYEGDPTTNPPPPPIPVPGEDYTHFVTSSASGGGNGSESSPWTWQQAFSLAPAGSVVGFYPGMYGETTLQNDNIIGMVTVTASGTSSNPITFRSIVPWEAKIVSPGGTSRQSDTRRAADPVVVIPQGVSDVNLVDFDIYCSTTTRVHLDSSADVSNPSWTIMPLGPGVAVFGSRVHILGCKIHDVRTPIEQWGTSSRGRDNIYADNLIYNWGFDSNTAGGTVGHGFYGQNGLGTCLFTHNIWTDGASLGGQVFGSSSAELQDFHFHENFWYDELIIGPKGGPATGIEHIGNVHANGQARFGFEWGNVPAELPHSTDWTITDNIFAALPGGSEANFLFRYMPDDSSFTFSRNTSVKYAGGYGALSLQYATPQDSWPYSNWTVEDNEFYGNLTHFFYANSGGALSLVGARDQAQWNTNFAASNTTSSTATPTGSTTKVWPSTFDENTGMVVILNWSASSSVSVDLSSFIEAGQQWVAYDSMNPGKGASDSGTGPSASFNFSGRTKERPIGYPTDSGPTPWVVKPVNSRVGAWVVRGQ